MDEQIVSDSARPPAAFSANVYPATDGALSADMPSNFERAQQVSVVAGAVNDNSAIWTSLIAARAATPAVVAADPPPAPVGIAVSPDGQLAAGTLYPDSVDSATTWYLPTYANNTADGRYTTKLKWRAADEPEGGPIAHLTVELAATGPAGATADSHEIAHVAVVRLTYAVPMNATTDAPVNGQQTVTQVEVGVLSTGPGPVRTCRLDITDKRDFDALYQAMTDATMGARLDIACQATIGHRELRPLFDVPVERIPDRARPEFPTRVHTATDGVFTQPVRRWPLQASVAVNQPSESVRAINDVLPAVFNQPGDNVRAIDDVLPVEIGNRPANALFRYRSVVVTGAATCTEEEPFCFPLATNASMFDIPGDLTPTTNEILLPIEIDVDGIGPTVFYQDSIYRDRFYVRPQAFRLSRSSTAPFLPDLRFAFLAVTSTGATDATVEYQVSMSYKAVPWVSPIVTESIRQHAAGETTGAPTLLPLLAQTTTLTLDLGLDTADPPGAIAPVARPAATVTFDSGIADQIALSPAELTRVIASLRSTGIDGVVSAVLPGATAVDIPLSLALGQTAGPAFTHSLAAGHSPGAWTVTLTNELESPVAITGLYPTVLPNGATARPDPWPTEAVQPGASVLLAYHVDPADAVVLDIAPAAELVAQIDAVTLLPQLMVNQGYASETFAVSLSIDGQYFAAPAPDGRSLTGVTVDFDSGASVLLTAAQPTATATLRYPLLAWLLGSATAEDFTYTVTNHWDSGQDGQASPPQPGSGAAALIVVPAAPE